MPSDWLPSKDALLLPFATNASSKITASPTSYGLLVGDATALASAVTGYSSALATSSNPSTRTKTAVMNKNVAKAQLVALIRSIAKRVQANPAVTAGQKTDLGLPVHSTTPTPVPTPSTVPELGFGLVTMGTGIVTLKITDADVTNKRAKPTGVQGAEVYSFVGATGTTPLPTNLEDWRFEGLATRSTFDINYRPEDAGKTATIVARWYNAKGDVGPTSSPITGRVAA
jgi:hypothetical protein